MRHREARAILAAALTLGASHLDAQGRFAMSFARPTWTSSQPFTDPVSVRELPDGRVLLSDVDEPALFLISAGGRTRTQLGRSGAGPGEYTAPTLLLGLQGDSTLLLDRDARRFLVIDPHGALVSTTPFPPALTNAVPWLRASDRAGRLYFQATAFGRGPGESVSILRWNRATDRIDSIGSFAAASPEPVTRTMNGHTVTTRSVMPYAAVEDWAIGSAGDLAVVQPAPYSVEWRQSDGSRHRGSVVRTPSIAVTDADRRRVESKGPPFARTYPRTKPSFVAGLSVIDHLDRLWVLRYGVSGQAQREYDVFDHNGNALGVVSMTSDRRLVGTSAHFAYVFRTDSDGLIWLEAFAWK